MVLIWDNCFPTKIIQEKSVNFNTEVLHNAHFGCDRHKRCHIVVQLITLLAHLMANAITVGTLNGSNSIISTQLRPSFNFDLLKNTTLTVALNASYHVALLSKWKCFIQSNLLSLKYQLVSGVKLTIVLSNGLMNAAYYPSKVAGAIISIHFSNEYCVCWNGYGYGKQSAIIDFWAALAINKLSKVEHLMAVAFFLITSIGHFNNDGNSFVVDWKKGYKHTKYSQ